MGESTQLIYLDNHATTPVDPRVLEAMLPYFTELYGNAASRTHPFGWKAEEAVSLARRQVAAVIGADPKEIVFTSGATESDNLAIKGVARAARQARGGKPGRIVTLATEHKAVVDACKVLEREGFEVVWLPVDRDGRVTADQVEAALTDDTLLVSVMLANNEIGVLQPVAEIGERCRARGVPLHCDAVQAVGKVPVDVNALGVDLLAISAHKMYGPKGAGALYVRRRRPKLNLLPQMDGGGHERGMRSGTLNVPGIVGLGKACELAGAELEAEAQRTRALRDRLLEKLKSRVEYVVVNGSLDQRLPGNLNISFAYVEGESLLMLLADRVAVSSGSACTSATVEPSYVLKALGVDDELAHASIRFGVGRFNTESDIDTAVELVVAAVGKLREMSPLYAMAQRGEDPRSVRWAPD